MSKSAKPIFITKDEANKILKKIHGRYTYLNKPMISTVLSMDGCIYYDHQQNIHIEYKEVVNNNDKLEKKMRHVVVDGYSPDVIEDYRLEDKTGYGRTAYKTARNLCFQCGEELDYPDNKKYAIYNEDDNYTNIYYRFLNYKFARNKFIEHCYSYDINFCFPAQFSKPLPYGEICKYDSYVLEGEIGFNSSITCDGKNTFDTVLPNEGRADYVFKTKIYGGLVAYAYYAFNLKNSASDEEYATVKAKQHAFLGVLLYHNIFLRTAILEYARREIEYWVEKYKDNVIMSTVDNLVSNVEIKDLPIGKEMGKFKVEHYDEKFIFASQDIKQWESDDFTKYKGVKKSRWINKNSFYDEPAVYYNSITGLIEYVDNRKVVELWPSEK